MRSFSWFLSCILHATLAVLLIYSVRLAPLVEPKVLKLDLTRIEPQAEQMELPAPEPPPSPAVPPPEEPEPQTLPEAPPPLPMDKTVVLDDTPPPPPSEPEATAEQSRAPKPEPEPDAVPIEGEPEKEPEPEEPPTAGTDLDKANVRRDHLTVHRGHEARFGRTLLADYYSYSSSEFSGQFTTREADRTISIIDARRTQYGRFLIYDSKNKTLRRLKKFNKYVYTVGPSLYEDEPVTGSVTFLAKDDRIERFILQTDDDRMAHYPRKVHVRETDTAFLSGEQQIPCTTTLPPEGEHHPGLVFVHGNTCSGDGLIRGFTRALSSCNLASLSFLPRGCGDAPPAPGSATEQVADTRAALQYLASQPQVAAAGLWGNGPGVPTVLRAASDDSVHPAFVICELNDDTAPEAMPDARALQRIGAPVLWIVTGHETAAWSDYVGMLESLRDDHGKRFSVILAPLKASRDVAAARSEESALIEQVTTNHAGLAASWIQTIER